MENEKYLKDIQDIKQMMSQSSQCLSLSGLSGILAGVYALLGASYSYFILTYSTRSNSTVETRLYITAASVVVASLLTGYILSSLKAKKLGEKIWSASSRRLIINFGIPLATGGAFGVILIEKGYYDLIASVTLLFYGMACVNASKYTFRDVRYLGISLIIIGLLAAYYVAYGLYFWALGFGVCHIIYGAMMHLKYERN